MYTIEDFLEIKSAGAPSFNFAGNKIAYVSNLSGTDQVYLTLREGGEAVQLTNFEDSVSSARFSPTKDEFIFSKAEGGNENFQLYLFDLSSKKSQPLTQNSKVKNIFGGWSPDGASIAYASNSRNVGDFDVYVMDISTRESKCVFQGVGVCMSTGFSPQGRFLIIRKQKKNIAHEIYIVDLQNGNHESILGEKEEAVWTNINWLPDDSGFFTITNENKDLLSVYFYDVENRSGKFILESKSEIEELSLTKDGQYLLAIENRDGYRVPAIYKADTLTPVSSTGFPLGIIGASCWSLDGKYLTFSLQTSTKQSDIWVWDRERDICTQLTRMSSRIPENVFVEPSLISYKSFDGLNVPAFVFLPREQKNTRLPVIINIHGGPESQYRPNFNPLIQYFVNAGYAVVAPNVRGSSGYGKRYLALDDKEKRMDSVKDLASLYAFLKLDQRFDSEKVFLMGGSYGGFMTLAGLAFYPELWAGGICTVGIANFITFLENTAPHRRALREAEYGSLAENRAFLEFISPINHVEDIKAPLMLVHGANDPRVPLSEAEQMHSKLKALGRKVELLVYSDEGHSLSKLRNRLDAYPRVVEFLKNVAKNTQ